MKYLLIFLIAVPVFAQKTEYPTATHYFETGSEPREHPIDIEKMRLEVSFDAPKGLVRGKVTHIFKPLLKSVDQIYFDGVELRISQALLNGKEVEFTNTGNGITVHPKPALSWDDKRDSITFIYEANPRQGIYFVGWKDTTGRMRRQIWTQGEDTDHRYWIPMFDEPNDKMLTEVTMTFDKSYRALANGKKVAEKENKDGTKTWTYIMPRPHASYLLMLMIGKYEVKNVTSKSGVPIQLWYYPDQADRLEPTFGYTVRAMDFLEEAIGVPYPWGNFSNAPVADFVTGAMENTTAVLTGDFWYVDARAFFDDNYIDTDVHEQAHQWFGDMITMRSWKHLWLQESFATYYGKKGCQKFFGDEYYEWNRRDEQNSAIRASLDDRLPLVHTQAGSSRYYPKGSAVIDMMNYVWGEEAYKRVISYYLGHHRFQNVETNDLVQAFMDTLGVTPDWFFEQWVYRGGEPHYEVSYLDHGDQNGRETEFTVRQTHAVDELTKLFRMPIVFEVYYADGTKDSVRETVSENFQKISVPNPGNKAIDYVLFDPGSWIVKDVTFEKPFEELKSQSQKAPHMIDRYDAVAAMRSHPAADKRDLLIQIFRKEKFHGIKAEIVSQLVNDPNEKSRDLIRTALQDKWPEVRKAVINGIGVISESQRSSFEGLLSDSSYNIVRTALSKLLTTFPKEADRYLEMTKDQYGLSREIKIDWLEYKAAHGDTKAMDQIIDYSSNSFEGGTRRTAFSAIKRFNYLDDRVLANMFDAMLNPNTGISRRASGLCDFYYQQAEMKNKIKAYYQDRTWEPWQKEILKKSVK